MKNPLKIVHENDSCLFSKPNGYRTGFLTERGTNLGIVLSNLAIAESNLVKAGKDSALPHFIAIVKELERLYGFKFEKISDEEPTA